MPDAKLRLPGTPSRLRLVKSEQDTTTEAKSTQQGTRIHRGVWYPAEVWTDLIGQSNGSAPIYDGLIGGYQPHINHGEPVPFIPGKPGVLWDEAAFCDLSSNTSKLTIPENEFQLLSCGLDSLSIDQAIDCSLLSIAPRFQIQYKTHAFPAQLGEIRLVSAKRFITDTDGNRHSLLDTETAGAPVLYLEDTNDRKVIRQFKDWQPLCSEQTYTFDYRISQMLKRQMQGVEVASITVLEHYSSYFMQRPMAATHTLWVPAYAPLEWGWSIRVEPEDDDWLITRRKLILPVAGHDGWRMPQWHNNTEDYR